MALNIKNQEVDRLVRTLAELTGESLTEVVLNALRERLRREQGRIQPTDLAKELATIRKRAARLQVLDDRPIEELVSYDEHGIPR